ncbi:MAG: hypothetical protein KAV25_00075 [Methanophagales archaeon]|nr:hypothetical protein [Methanophagales archaeon]
MVATQVMIALIVATLTFITYFIATKWFNREISTGSLMIMKVKLLDFQSTMTVPQNAP